MSSVDYTSLERFRDDLSLRNKAHLGKFKDIRLSYWSFNNYKTCPQRFLLLAQRLPAAQKVEDEFYSLQGSIVHSVWEDYTRKVKTGELEWSDRDFLKDDIPARYDEKVSSSTVSWANHGMEPSEHRKLAIPELYKSVDFVLDALTQEGIIPCDPAYMHPEVSFETQLSPHIKIVGRVDFVREWPKNDYRSPSITVIDFKDVAKRANVSWRQLIWYVLGLEPVFGKPVDKAGFLLTKLGEWSWRNPNQKNYRETLTREIFETAIKIRRDPFPARVDRHNCSFCNVQSLCPEWQRYASRNQALLEIITSLPEGNTTF